MNVLDEGFLLFAASVDWGRVVCAGLLGATGGQVATAKDGAEGGDGQLEQKKVGQLKALNTSCKKCLNGGLQRGSLRSQNGRKNVGAEQCCRKEVEAYPVRADVCAEDLVHLHHFDGCYEV